MATIALYANKINQMPGLIKDIKESVIDYKSELFALKTKTLTINKSVCNLDDVISSIQTSTQTQEQKIASLDTFSQNSENFISDVVRIDGNVADVVKQRKDDFYNQYNYLKPECEKNGWEKFCDELATADEWCKEHWKEILITIVIVIGAVLAIAAVICTGGMALAPLIASGLTALGVSAGTALTIATVTSLAVAGVAIASTLASSTLNIKGTWCDMSNNPTFKAWQTAMNWTSAISNLAYSVGSIYNGFKGISNGSLRAYSKNYLTNSNFRNAITGADKFNLVLKPNSSTFWSAVGDNDMGWYNGDLVASNVAEKMGRTTLETTLQSNGISMPQWTAHGGPTAWNGASASYALNSSGDVSALIGQGLRNQSIWNTTERVLLNINSNVTSITTFTVNGATAVNRVFEWGSLFSGLFSAGQGTSNIVNETEKK